MIGMQEQSPPMLGIRYFKTHRGDEPVQEYLHQISQEDAACLYGNIAVLKQDGYLTYPHGRIMHGHPGLFEIRYKAHRVFYTVKNQTVILLHAFRKQSRKTPLKEIHVAKRRMNTL